VTVFVGVKLAPTKKADPLLTSRKVGHGSSAQR
jgi:hypothetical protein